MTQILAGKPVAEAMAEMIREKLNFFQERGVTPSLAIVQFGDDAAAAMYGQSLRKKAEQAGLKVRCESHGADVDEKAALAILEDLNAAEDVDGILLLMPLPGNWDTEAFVRNLSPAKDIDGITPTQAGLLATGRPALVPATARACLAVLAHYGLPMEGKHAVVIGRSDVIGKPVARLLLAENATVTICHSRTRDLPAMTRQADILVAAVGKPEMVGVEMVNPQAVVLDVGIHRVEGRTTGDTDPRLAEHVQAYTPVPGGIGAVTTAMMMDNVLEAAAMRRGWSFAELKK